jgi:N4-(beta-N-acetylglucosaminyl)-L-asparaginase
MSAKLTRRQVLGTTAAVAATPIARAVAPEVLIPAQSRPVVIASRNGHTVKNGGPETCVERAFRLMTTGSDVLEALIAGVNIVELDPADTSVGYGGLPNADGVVQLDSCCMHGPRSPPSKASAPPARWPTRSC